MMELKILASFLLSRSKRRLVLIGNTKEILSFSDCYTLSFNVNVFLK